MNGNKSLDNRSWNSKSIFKVNSNFLFTYSSTLNYMIFNNTIACAIFQLTWQSSCSKFHSSKNALKHCCCQNNSIQNALFHWKFPRYFFSIIYLMLNKFLLQNRKKRISTCIFFFQNKSRLHNKWRQKNVHYEYFWIIASVVFHIINNKS